MKNLIAAVLMLAGGMLWAAEKSGAPVAGVVYEGQIFNETRGAPHRFGGVKVYAFPLVQLGASALAHPLAQTTTDADGRFRLTVPGEPHFIFCQTARIVSAEAETTLQWTRAQKDIDDPHGLMLTTETGKRAAKVEIN